MKTKNQYHKENCMISVIWNIPSITFFALSISYINLPTYILIGSVAILFVILCIRSLDSWYNDYRFEELDKQIKELQNKKA